MEEIAKIYELDLIRLSKQIAEESAQMSMVLSKLMNILPTTIVLEIGDDGTKRLEYQRDNNVIDKVRKIYQDRWNTMFEEHKKKFPLIYKELS